MEGVSSTMAAKASRTYTLLLLIALSVASLTVTVAVPPVAVASSSGGPAANGDPDRPNDCPKPTVAQQSSSSNLVSTSRRGDMGGKGAAHGWSWAMEYIATLLGRHGL